MNDWLNKSIDWLNESIKLSIAHCKALFHGFYCMERQHVVYDSDTKKITLMSCNCGEVFYDKFIEK